MSIPNQRWCGDDGILHLAKHRFQFLPESGVVGLDTGMRPILLTMLATSSFFAADIVAVTKQELPSLVKLYQELHANPELSMHESETAARIAKELRAAGLEVTEKVGGNGIVGVLKNGDGPQPLNRGEFDKKLGSPLTDEEWRTALALNAAD